MHTAGPILRTDIAELYIARASDAGVVVLQLRRSNEPMRGTWQPVMGHIVSGESAVEAVVR